MAESPLALHRSGDVVWCTLDRPPLNLFEPGLIRALDQAFGPLAADRATRLAVVTGAGRAFTAGMDVRYLRDLDAAGAKALITALCGAIDAVHRAAFPVIAAANGAGRAPGWPGVRVGVPSVTRAPLLPPLVGPGRAAELLLTGEPITAEQAREWG